MVRLYLNALAASVISTCLSVGTSQALPATRAYLSVEPLQQLVNEQWGSHCERYTEIISRALSLEDQFDASHHVFYHGQRRDFILLQDLITAWYRFLHPEEGCTNFHFLRVWHDHAPSIDAQSFIDEFEAGTSSWNDNHEPLRSTMLSVNFSLFGSSKNHGHHGKIGFGECSFKYFFSNHSIKIKDARGPLLALFERYQFDKKYLDQLLELYSLIESHEGTLVQIFVPKHHVDAIGFAAQRLGSPMRTPVLHDYFDSGKQRHIALSPLLDRYRNAPESIDHITLDRLQGRLLFSQHLLLNPRSGVQIFRHTTINPTNLTLYQEKFNRLTRKMFRNWFKRFKKGRITTDPAIMQAASALYEQPKDLV